MLGKRKYVFFWVLDVNFHIKPRFFKMPRSGESRSTCSSQLSRQSSPRRCWKETFVPRSWLLPWELAAEPTGRGSFHWDKPLDLASASLIDFTEGLKCATNPGEKAAALSV